MDNKTDTSAQRPEEKLYELTWRNKRLAADATSIGDMISSLKGAADKLRAMKARGVTLDQDGGENARAILITTDPAVAQEFGFEARRYVREWCASDVAHFDGSLGEIIERFQGFADQLRAMKARGVVAEYEGEGHYLRLVTCDPAVAQEFGFRAGDWFEDDGEDAEDDTDDDDDDDDEGM